MQLTKVHNTLKSTQDYAEKFGCIVERVGRRYEWYRKNDHSIVGVCDTLREVRCEIFSECRYTRKLVPPQIPGIKKSENKVP